MWEDDCINVLINSNIEIDSLWDDDLGLFVFGDYLFEDFDEFTSGEFEDAIKPDNVMAIFDGGDKLQCRDNDNNWAETVDKAVKSGNYYYYELENAVPGEDALIYSFSD